MRFANIDVNEKVHLFKESIKNIIRNYIPHEIITCDDRDPLWINKVIKELTKPTSHIVKIKTTYALFISSNVFNQS